MMQSVELFAGAGGLAMGIARAGFNHRAVIERDRWACDSVRENKRRRAEDQRLQGIDFLVDWPEPYQGDVRDFDYTPLAGSIDLVSGGPPCQPFSVGGKHRGFRDDRDMFPEAARAVRELQPRAFIFENVRGLLRPAFAEYFEYVLLRLTYPELTRETDDHWMDHLARLERHHTAGTERGLVYNVTFRAVNAADYGVPQSRARVILVGFRSDLGVEWNFPEPSHSREALVYEKWSAGAYWDEHRVARRDRPEPTKAEQSMLIKLRRADDSPAHERWRTVRDALADLPDPEQEPVLARKINNHVFQPGARAYPGHTGSPWDLPAKTLKAGVHGVPGGENMLARYDGTVRYFSVREAGRLQTFPDEYVIEGAWTEAMRQLGNAVPVHLAERIGSSIARVLQTLDEAPEVEPG
jgi:DNA (cytosine-5)-methyltransferase 1